MDKMDKMPMQQAGHAEQALLGIWRACEYPAKKREISREMIFSVLCLFLSLGSLAYPSLFEHCHSSFETNRL